MNLYEVGETYSEPIIKVDSWIQESIKAKVALPHAMNLATVDKRGFPSSRMVLLKSLSEEGLVFFTDYSSRKGIEIIENGRAAINFWWAKINKAIRIEGLCSKVSLEESDAYFNSRPFASKISAAISNQSQIITSYEALEKKANKFEEELKGKEVSRPSRWGGFILKPNRIEFWADKPNRLHVREVFLRLNSSWEKTYLSP